MVSMVNRLSTEAAGAGHRLPGRGQLASARTVRLTGAAKNTVDQAAASTWATRARSTRTRTLRNLACQRVQVDEIWSFVGCQEDERQARAQLRTTATRGPSSAIDADTKLVPSWCVGQRDADDA